MAESIVQVTEGSGKKLHTFQRTIGANSVEDEVVLQGENYLGSYIFTTPSVSVATAASHPLQIMAGASLKLRIRLIEVYLTVPATAAAFMNITPVRLTTAGTGGTVVAANGVDPGDGATGATGMTLPTVKGTEGTAAIWNQWPYMLQTIAASAPMAQPIARWDWDRPRSKPFIITAGVANGFALKNITAVAGASISVTVIYDESSF